MISTQNLPHGNPEFDKGKACVVKIVGVFTNCLSLKVGN